MRESRGAWFEGCGDVSIAIMLYREVMQSEWNVILYVVIESCSVLKFECQGRRIKLAPAGYLINQTVKVRCISRDDVHSLDIHSPC